MTRLMGDAIHDQVPALAQVPGLQLVAGYVTGSPDIQWTTADWMTFPQPKVTIDQGFTGAPQYGANVIDVETGAWSPAQVPGWMAKATAPRPAVYCNRSTLPAVLATGWRGALWLAIPGWKLGDPLPLAPPTCTIVAVQDQFEPAYDLSTVLDPTWPLEADVVIPGVPGFWLSVQILSSADGSKQVAIGLGTDGGLWQTVRANGVWGATTPL